MPVLKALSGIEVESLSDMIGMGPGCVCTVGFDGKLQVNYLHGAYDNILAFSPTLDEFCISTDANRTDTRAKKYPPRIGFEFRSGPEAGMNHEVLHLLESYSTWLLAQKEALRSNLRDYPRGYAAATSNQQKKIHYLKFDDFIKYYNELSSSLNKLEITLPKDVFGREKAGPDFQCDFSDKAFWALELKYEDLIDIQPVFGAQVNLCIPVGAVFRVREYFKLGEEYPLVDREKEVAPVFHECRPTVELDAYEQDIYTKAMHMADEFFLREGFHASALGAKDFLRCMLYEIAMISTSEAYLKTLLMKQAQWIAKKHQAADPNQTRLSKRYIDDIAVELAATVSKTLFPYFMKTTLAHFFKALHPYEQKLLKDIDRDEIQNLCTRAVALANGGVGNTDGHPSHFVIGHDCFMEVFDGFYNQTFKGQAVVSGEIPDDPIAWLTVTHIPTTDLSADEQCPLPGIVVEIRRPPQGDHTALAMRALLLSAEATHRKLLDDCSSLAIQRASLNGATDDASIASRTRSRCKDESNEEIEPLVVIDIDALLADSESDEDDHADIDPSSVASRTRSRVCHDKNNDEDTAATAGISSQGMFAQGSHKRRTPEHPSSPPDDPIPSKKKSRPN